MVSEAFTNRDYDLKSVELINSQGVSIDVRYIMTELQIYQDLFSSVMSGEILLIDGTDMLNTLSMCGNEYIKIIIDKPGLNEPLEKMFRIYKVTDRSIEGNSSQQYTLHFCSEDLIFSNQLLLSKSYKDLRISDMIEDILLNQLKVDRGKIHALQITDGNYDIIVPGYRPLEAAQWLAGRAYNVSPQFCYFFYESTRGYNFVSLQTMYSQPASKKLLREIKQLDYYNIYAGKDSLDDVQILNDFDLLTSITNGAYSSILMSVDLFSRTKVEYGYTLGQALLEDRLLNKNLPINLPQNKDGLTPIQAGNSFLRTYAQIIDNPGKSENTLDKWMLPRALHLAALNAFKFQGIIPGDILLNVGDIIQIDFPTAAAPRADKKDIDEYRSGRYLVTSLNHKFREDDFTTIVEFCTDSYGSPLPAATFPQY